MVQLKQKVRITVLGPKSSGKTALIFRYLARLSLNTNSNCQETVPRCDNIYNHCVCLDGLLYDLEIVDLANPNDDEQFRDSSDAFIVVYSVASRSDFEEAAKECKRLNTAYPERPVLLVGNKSDLTRQVEQHEGHKINGELFVEVCATRDRSWEVHQAMYLLLRKVSQLHPPLQEPNLWNILNIPSNGVQPKRLAQP